MWVLSYLMRFMSRPFSAILASRFRHFGSDSVLAQPITTTIQDLQAQKFGCREQAQQAPKDALN